MQNRKSQMEILGLAIVVVLMILAAIFVVRFMVLKGPTNYRKGFVSSELASNMLNTFLKTNAVECKQLTMTELLQDCAQSSDMVCDDPDSSDSCAYLELIAKDIFDETIRDWNVDYEFLAYKENESPFISIGKPCSGEKKSKLYPIPIKADTIYVKLDICG